MGNEEDFVDELSAICFLYPRKRNERDPKSVEKLLAVADSWRLAWELDRDKQTPAYWDIHSLDIQRFYNIVCLIYGSDPDRHAKLPDMMKLPWQRAWSCEDYEYRQTIEAVQWLLKTYGTADEEVAAKDSGKIVITYETPTTTDRMEIQHLIQTSRVVEKKARMVESLFSLPNDIRITVANCLGDATSF